MKFLHLVLVGKTNLNTRFNVVQIKLLIFGRFFLQTWLKTPGAKKDLQKI